MKKLMLGLSLLLISMSTYAADNWTKDGHYATICIKGYVVAIIQSDKGMIAFQMQNDDKTFMKCND